MIRVPVISVVREGLIEEIALYLRDPLGEPRNVIRQAIDEGEVTRQLARARQVAHTFLARPYVRPLAAESLRGGTLVAEFPEKQSYEGGSFGLAFLVGCLALGLDVKPRAGALFSAALGDQVKGAGGGGCGLGPVTALTEKLSAACLERQAKLFLYPNDEREVLEFERGFWRGDVDRSCFPYVLPKTISTAAVVCLGLDLELLWRRMTERGIGHAFALRMLAAGGELDDAASYVTGVGRAVSSLRRGGQLPASPDIAALAEDLGLAGKDPEEVVIPQLVFHTARYLSEDEQKRDLIKGAISNDPERPLIATAGAEEGDAAASDMDAWLDEDADLNILQLIMAVEVLRLCEQVTPDMEPYWGRARRLVLGSFRALLEDAIQLAGSDRRAGAVFLLKALSSAGFPTRLGQVRQPWAREAWGLAEKCLRAVEPLADDNLTKAARELAQRLAVQQMPAAIGQLIAEREDRGLALTFEVSKTSPRRDRECSEPNPPLRRINDLDLYIAGPAQLSLHVPSPVLLMEGCFRQHCRYCRRREARLSSDTMSRFPPDEADVAWRHFAQPGTPTAIGFRVTPESPAASVYWVPGATPWPAAIDSHLFVAGLLQYERETRPKRLLDVGCGTGFLTVCAAHLWPSLRELNIVDCDPLAVAAAEANLAIDGRASRCMVNSHVGDFQALPECDCDMLLCAPPYLPDRPTPAQGIEMATNGTALLEEVVRRGHRFAPTVWLSFSVIAWPEFERAMAQVPYAYRTVEVLRRDLVPFRLPWLEPRSPEEEGDPQIFRRRCDYYEGVLMPRGLIDLDSGKSSAAYLDDCQPRLAGSIRAELISPAKTEPLERCLDELTQSVDASRGYRFWHEVRAVRLSCAD